MESTGIEKNAVQNGLIEGGADEFTPIKRAFVVVVGLGGVGSHAANMLARSGVQRMRLVDFDQVTLSSLNRHAVATMDDVGIPKVEALRRCLKKVVPWVEIEAVAEMFRGEVADSLLSGQPTFVLDCIDDINTKAELLAYCISHSIPVITSTGAGAKADPTKLRVGLLSDCVKDPLASKLKWKLKKFGIAAEQITTVFSVEKPVCELIPLSDEQRAAPQDFGAVEYLRLRVMPVLGTSPAVFGQTMASYVTCMLAGKPYEPDSCERMSKNLRHKMLQFLRNNEQRRFGSVEFINLDDDELEFLVQQVWKNRCAATDRRIGGHAALVLSRWDVKMPPEVNNLVLLTQPEAARLESEGQGAFSNDIRRKISQRLKWAASVFSDDYPGISLPSKNDISSNNTSNSPCPESNHRHRSAILCTVGFFAVSLLKSCLEK